MHLEYREGGTTEHSPICERAPDTRAGRARMRGLLRVSILRWHAYDDGEAVARACPPGQADNEDPIRAVYLVDAS